MKMLHAYRASHVLGVILDVEYDDGILFLGLTQGKVNMRPNYIGQISSNFQNQNFLAKAYLSCPVVSHAAQRWG